MQLLQHCTVLDPGACLLQRQAVIAGSFGVLPGTSDASQLARPLVYGRFRVGSRPGTRMLVVNAHLKSGAEARLDVKHMAELLQPGIRALQLPAAAEVVVVGDFNLAAAKPDWKAFRQLGFRAVSDGLSAWSTNLLGTESYDNIWCTTSSSAASWGTNGAVLPPAAAGGQPGSIPLEVASFGINPLYSDHRLVMSDFSKP